MSRDQGPQVVGDARPVRAVRLSWKGPYELQQLAQGFEQAGGRPGVYLWTLPLKEGAEIAYVGQAADLEARMQQHIFYTLGGGYCLYEPEELRAGQVTAFTKNMEYSPGLHDSMEKLLEQLPRFQQMARENLQCYHYFWAEVSAWSGDAAKDRQLVESALIRQAEGVSSCLQNARVSVAPRTDMAVAVESVFCGQGVRGLGAAIVY